jgi:hypothetical protein
LPINGSFDAVTNETLQELLVSDNIPSSVNKISSDIVGFALLSPASKPLNQERLQQMMQESKTLTTLVYHLDKLVADPKERAPSCFSIAILRH